MSVASAIVRAARAEKVAGATSGTGGGVVVARAEAREARYVNMECAARRCFMAAVTAAVRAAESSGVFFVL